MTKDDFFELQFLWEFFKTPRSMSERNKKLLIRLKELVIIKLQEEIKNS